MPKARTKTSKPTAHEVIELLRRWNAGPMPRWLRELSKHQKPQPCPFCGSKELSFTESERGRIVWCDGENRRGCNAQGPDKIPGTRIWTGHAGNHLATLAWNLRNQAARGCE